MATSRSSQSWLAVVRSRVKILRYRTTRRCMVNPLSCWIEAALAVQMVCTHLATMSVLGPARGTEEMLSCEATSKHSIYGTIVRIRVLEFLLAIAAVGI